MRTDMLFGVQFTREERTRQLILDDYKNKKIAHTMQSLENDGRLALLYGKILGIKGEDVHGALKEFLPERDRVLDFSYVEQLIDNTGCKQYYITGPVLDMCKKISIKEPYDVEWLAPVSDGKRQLNFGNSFIRYNKVGNDIFVLHSAKDKQEDNKSYLQYSFYRVDLANKSMGERAVLDDYDPNFKPKVSIEDFEKNSKVFFLQLITFMELAKPEEVLLKPGQKNGTKKSSDSLLNEEKYPFTLVKTNWNKLIRTQGFDVTGHIRKQRIGPGLSQRRLVWIDPYHKEGYNLATGKSRAQDKKSMRR